MVSCLGEGSMEDFHLTRKELFQPFVLLYNVMNELDSQLAVDFNSPFTFLFAVEPRLCPPYYAVLVRIDTDCALYIETLYVYFEVCKGIDDALTGYCVISSFFFRTRSSLKETLRA